MRKRLLSFFETERKYIVLLLLDGRNHKKIINIKASRSILFQLGWALKVQQSVQHLRGNLCKLVNRYFHYKQKK